MIQKQILKAFADDGWGLSVCQCGNPLQLYCSLIDSSNTKLQGILDRVDFCQPVNTEGDGTPPQPDTLVMDVDLIGIIWSSYLALNYFRKNASRGGKLVMTSSSAGIYAISEIPLYAAAKHGVCGGQIPLLHEIKLMIC